MRIGFKNDGDGHGPVLWLLGQRLGDEDALRRTLAPVLCLKADKEVVQERHFWDAQDYLMERPRTPAASVSKSLVPDRFLDQHTTETIIDWVQGWQPGRTGNAGYVTLFAMGGASTAPLPARDRLPAP